MHNGRGNMNPFSSSLASFPSNGQAQLQVQQKHQQERKTRLLDRVKQYPGIPFDPNPSNGPPPPTIDLDQTHLADAALARALLVYERINSPDYRPADQQKRDKWLRVTEKQKEAARDQNLWNFSKHEVAKTLHRLLSRPDLPPPGTAQALLLHAAGTSLGDLWRHLHDANLERAEGKWFKTVSSSAPSGSTWLDRVTAEGNIDYINLLCKARPGQDALDRALGTALCTKSPQALKVLISFGARASPHREAIREFIRLNNVDLARIFMSAAMPNHGWRYCLAPQVDLRKQPPTILHMFLSNDASIACEDLLLQALQSQHLEATAVLLAHGYPTYIGPTSTRRHLRSEPCKLASLVTGDQLRYEFFSLLAEAELIYDCEFARLELFNDVEARHLPLIQLLVDVGVGLDDQYGSLIVHRAISTLDWEVLECLRNMPFPVSPLLALGFAPESAPESDICRLLDYLQPRGIQGPELNDYLILVTDRQQIKLVEKFVELGASVEHQGGAAFLIAARSCNVALLNVLHQGKPPKSIISEAVSVAFLARHTCGYEASLAAVKALVAFGAQGKPLDQALLAAAEVNDLTMVNIMARNGADANYAGGSSFKFAIQAQYYLILWVLCETSPPTRQTVEAVLPIAIEPCNYRLDSLELLLASSRLKDNQLEASWSPPLELETLRDNPHLHSILGCFLRHGLSVDFDGGAMLSLAVEKMNDTLLLDMLKEGPNTVSLAAAFQAAVTLDTQEGGPPREFQLTAMRALLDASKGEEIGQSDALLIETLIAIQRDASGLDILLTHGANVDQDNGSALQAAAATASSVILDKLLQHSPSANSLAKAIFLTEQSPVLSDEQKDHVFTTLLDAGNLVLAADHGLDKLLSLSVTSLPQNARLPELVILRGARAGLELGKESLLSVSRDLFGVLVATLSSEDVTETFRTACTLSMDSDRRYWVYELLLGKGEISRDITSMALRNIICSWSISRGGVSPNSKEVVSHGIDFDLMIIYLLLSRGADPNTAKSICFLLAADLNSETVFRLLSPHANLTSVLKALMGHFTSESPVLHWFNICVDELPVKTLLDGDDHMLLFDAMRKFPQGAALVSALLDRGASGSSSTTTHRFCPEWPEESCTLLIWALFSSESVENEMIIALLKCMGESALPEYSTEHNSVTAALGCVLHKGRSPVLRRVSSLVGKGFLDQTTPRATLARLTATSEEAAIITGLPPEVTLRQASLFVGNFEAYRVLVESEVPNDGTLHTAALLALPQFVKWLLNFHDADAKDADFDQMIPLAIACRSRPCPWSIVADQEADWETRRNETIRVLAANTSPKWKHNQKTILHIALEEGLAVTKVLTEALNLKDDPHRDEKYLYVDKSGIEYSPDEWVSRIMDVGELEQKEKLVSYLQKLGLQSRYFRRVRPGEGQQPEGYKGLPPGYDAAWDPSLEPKLTRFEDSSSDDDEVIVLKPLRAKDSLEQDRLVPPHLRRPLRYRQRAPPATVPLDL